MFQVKRGPSQTDELILLSDEAAADLGGVKFNGQYFGDAPGPTHQTLTRLLPRGEFGQ